MIALDAHALASLAAIAEELRALSNTMRLIASLEAEIVLDMTARRAAERASYAAFHRAYAEAESKAEAVEA